MLAENAALKQLLSERGLHPEGIAHALKAEDHVKAVRIKAAFVSSHAVHAQPHHPPDNARRFARISCFIASSFLSHFPPASDGYPQIQRTDDGVNRVLLLSAHTEIENLRSRIAR